MSRRITKPSKITNRMKAEVLMKHWLGNQDIMILAECGMNKAIEIKHEIQQQILAEGLKLAGNKVSKQRVLDYLEINENYIFRLAKVEQQLGLADTTEGSRGDHALA